MQCERNRTVVEVKGWSERVTRDAGILSLGSCFSMEIGNKLAEEGYGICSNPFGVLYNPASIANSIDFLAHGRIFTDSSAGPQTHCSGRRRIRVILPPRLVRQTEPGRVSKQCQRFSRHSILRLQKGRMAIGYLRHLLGLQTY